MTMVGNIVEQFCCQYYDTPLQCILIMDNAALTVYISNNS